MPIPKDWILDFTFTKDYSKDLEIVSALFEFEFRSNLLLVVATIPNQPDSWHRAGYLRKYVAHDDFGLISLDFQPILLQPMIIQWKLDDLPYQLKFNAEHWLQQITIKIYKPDPQLVIIPEP